MENINSRYEILLLKVCIIKHEITLEFYPSMELKWRPLQHVIRSASEAV